MTPRASCAREVGRGRCTCTVLAWLLMMMAGSSVACGHGSEYRYSGATEPIVRVVAKTDPTRAVEGQFFPGPLQEGTEGPALSIRSRNGTLVPGQGGRSFWGTADKGATSVALRFVDLGTGYWVVPVALPDSSDVTRPDAIGWNATIDFGWDLPDGEHELRAVAIDAARRHGSPSGTPLTVNSQDPDQFFALSLVWDTNVDLDLQIVAPSGKKLDSKHPTTAFMADGGTVPPGSGVLDRDSNGGCVIDNIREEKVTWKSGEPPEPGTYSVLVDMFSACGQISVNFVLRLYREGEILATHQGRLLDIDADGGEPGLLVTQFEMQ